jgi:hypothetical protein
LVNNANLAGGEIAISLNGIDQILLRAQECELFEPPGIAATMGSVLWNLISEIPASVTEITLDGLSVECPSERIAEYIASRNSDWTRIGTELHLKSEGIGNLDAESFGGIRFCTTDSLESSDPRSAAEAQDKFSPARLAWVEGMVLKAFGTKGKIAVQEYLRNPTSVNFLKLGDVRMSPLMPYLMMIAGERLSARGQIQ